MLRRLLGGLAAAGVLLLAAPPPSSAWHALWSTAAGAGPGAVTRPLVALASLVGEAVAGWLLLTVLLTAGTRARGRLGRACAAALRRTAPATVRRAVALALGVGVALGTAGTASAAGSPPAGATPVASAAAGVRLDWPLAGPAVGGTGPSAAPAASAPPPAPSVPPAAAAPQPVVPAPPAGSGTDVVVHPGDSLWSIAARALPAGARPAQVAAAWPAWWQANRQVIGADPDLLLPGQHLHPPR